MASKKLTEEQEQVLRLFFEFMIDEPTQSELQKVLAEHNVSEGAYVDIVSVFVGFATGLTVTQVKQNIPRIGNMVLEEKYKSAFEQFKAKPQPKTKKTQEKTTPPPQTPIQTKSENITHNISDNI